MSEKYTESQKKASLKYAKENLKRVPLDLSKSDYDALKAHTKKTGESVNGFIKRIIKENIEDALK